MFFILFYEIERREILLYLFYKFSLRSIWELKGNYELIFLMSIGVNIF